MVFAYNHDLERRNVQKEDMEMILEGAVESVVKAVIDEEHCNPFKAWKDMGSPEYLKKEHLEYEGKRRQNLNRKKVRFLPETAAV